MSTQAIETKYLSYTQASVYTGLSVSTLKRLVASGQLHPYRCGPSGRAVRFDVQHLDALIRGEIGGQSV